MRWQMVSLATKRVSPHHVSHVGSKQDSVTHCCNFSLFIAVQVGSIRLLQLCRAPVAPLGFWLQKLLFYFSGVSYKLQSGTEDQTFPQRLHLCSAKMNCHKLQAYSEALLSVHFFSILPYKQRKKLKLKQLCFRQSMIWCQQNVGIILKHLLPDFENVGKASLMKREHVLE